MSTNVIKVNLSLRSPKCTKASVHVKSMSTPHLQHQECQADNSAHHHANGCPNAKCAIYRGRIRSLASRTVQLRGWDNDPWLPIVRARLQLATGIHSERFARHQIHNRLATRKQARGAWDSPLCRARRASIRQKRQERGFR